MMWLFSVEGKGGLPVFMSSSPGEAPAAARCFPSSQDIFCHSLPSVCRLPLTVTGKSQLNSAAEKAEQREAGQAEGNWYWSLLLWVRLWELEIGSKVASCVAGGVSVAGRGRSSSAKCRQAAL